MPLSDHPLGFTLTWQQASGHSFLTGGVPDSEDRASMGIEAYDIADNLVYTNRPTPYKILPALTWKPQSLTGTLPAETHYVKVWQMMKKYVGSTFADGYIDNIQLTIEEYGVVPLINPGAESGVGPGGIMVGWTNSVGTLAYFNGTTPGYLPAAAGAFYYVGRGNDIAAWQRWPLPGNLDIRPTLVDGAGAIPYLPSTDFGGSDIKPILVQDSDTAFPFALETVIAPIKIARELERNPFRAHLSDDEKEVRQDLQEQQRVLREQHNKTQAGDTTFDYGLLLRTYPNQEFTLGSLGRFFHDDYGLIQARFCQFRYCVNHPYQGQPVGRIKDGDELVDWVVTNDFDRSDPDLIAGVMFVGETPPDDYYGWVVVSGANPAAIRMETSDTPRQNSAFTWTSTGNVGLDSPGRILGRRWGRAYGTGLATGTLFITLEGPSLMDLIEIIQAENASIVEDIAALDARVVSAEGKLVLHSGQITEHGTLLTQLTNRIASEERTRAREIQAIRNATVTYDIEGAINTAKAELREEFRQADESIRVIATQARDLATDLQTTIAGWDFAGLRADVDALAAIAGGGLGFTYDTTSIAADKVFIVVTTTNADGNPVYTLTPIDYKLTALKDYDNSTPATNGQVPTWNTAAGKWVPTNPGGLSDGDKGDITVSSSGAVWTVDNDVITYAKIQNVSAAERILGRKTGVGAGDVQELTISELLDLVLPGSMAQGDILYRGASAWSRLPANTAGKVLTTNGTGANPSWANVTSSGGATARPWYYDPPLAANLTTATSSGVGATLTDDSDVGLRIAMPNPAGTNLRHFFYVAIPTPGGDWDFKARITGTSSSGGTAVGVGIMAYESATNKILDFERYNGQNVQQVHWTAGLNGGRTAVSGVSAVDATINWFRFKRVGTSIECYWSGNGKSWVLWNTQLLTARFTTQPDRIGIFILQDRTTGMAMTATCDYWSLT